MEMFSLLHLSEAAAWPWHGQEEAAVQEHVFGTQCQQAAADAGSNRDGGLFSQAILTFLGAESADTQ